MRKGLIWIVVAVAAYLAVDEFNDGIRKENMASRSYRSGQQNASLSPNLYTDANSPMEIAAAYLKSHKDQLHLQPYHEFKAIAIESPTGTTVKYSVYQDNIPVVGLGIEINISEGKGASVISVQNNYRPIPKGDLTKGMPLDQIIKRVSQRYIAEESSLSNSSVILYSDSVHAKPELVYVLKLKEASGRKREVQVLFRASDGLILGKTVPQLE